MRENENGAFLHGGRQKWLCNLRVSFISIKNAVRLCELRLWRLDQKRIQRLLREIQTFLDTVGQAIP